MTYDENDNHLPAVINGDHREWWINDKLYRNSGQQPIDFGNVVHPNGGVLTMYDKINAIDRIMSENYNRLNEEIDGCDTIQISYPERYSANNSYDEDRFDNITYKDIVFHAESDPYDEFLRIELGNECDDY